MRLPAVGSLDSDLSGENPPTHCKQHPQRTRPEATPYRVLFVLSRIGWKWLSRTFGEAKVAPVQERLWLSLVAKGSTKSGNLCYTQRHCLDVTGREQ